MPVVTVPGPAGEPDGDDVLTWRKFLDDPSRWASGQNTLGANDGDVIGRVPRRRRWVARSGRRRTSRWPSGAASVCPNPH